MNEEKVIFSLVFTEEEIQNFAEDHLDRQLTDAELKNIREYWWEMDIVPCVKNDLLVDVIKMIKDLNEKSTV